MTEKMPLLIEEYYPPWDRWFENRIYPTPDGISIFFHVITERKRAETLREAAEREAQAGYERFRRVFRTASCSSPAR